MQYVERCLWWSGMVSRRAIVEKYGCSGQHASAVLQAYKEVNPRAMSYDLSVKRYLAHPKMKCLYEVSSFASELDKNEDGVQSIKQPLKEVDEQTLRRLMVAVRQGRKVRMKYQSRTTSEASWRKIAPHAFGHDGVRYHCRAWCYQNEEYRDFSLLRVQEIEWPKDKAEGVDQVDEAWNTQTIIHLRINPKASEALKAALVEDYGLQDENEAIIMRCSLAMEPYVLYRMGLDAGLPGGAFFIRKE